MTDINKPERVTQNRVIDLFVEPSFPNYLGYQSLGNLEDEDNNSNIETVPLSDYLRKKGYNSAQISKALDILQEVANKQGQALADTNREVYQLLRYGIPVKEEAGKVTESVWVIDWQQPESNDFYLAEEVTVFGEKEKRPDIVLYINGIAIAVLELKNSRKDLAEGIRQNITNQQPEFISRFFTTVQLVLAGNDSQGLRYGTVGTEAKFFLNWKEDEQDNTTYKLDKYLAKLCNKRRLVELIYDFVLFDGGIKKLPRVHQYFGIKAAQEFIRRREGGIIWHTQGSGKSITMVLLAKWLLENNPHARVVIVTDRDELDKQIERVFNAAGEPIYRTHSGQDLMRQLGEATPRLLCSLVFKFGKKDVDNFEVFIKDLQNQPSHAVGELFIFVDECHRTHSGKLHRTMKAMLPNALFIGFTGTPLLKKDKPTSLEAFGGYIHTYKYKEAVEDGVVLDLIYEARDIDQRLSSQTKIDEWFNDISKELNEFQKAELKKKWGTMQKVLSSQSRMEKIVFDIVHDFKNKARLDSQLGNAILVASSIYEACRYYELFQSTPLRDKCAVVTSYNPQTKDIATENTGADTDTNKETTYKIYTELLKNVTPSGKKSKTETYEDDVKKRFIEQPAKMKLLVVVDKLLTGFDAPKCSYLYIDKSMQDHGLFQAICRVNRLDSDDKKTGCIVDYKDLFKKVETAFAVYTSELDHNGVDKSEGDILLKDRLKAGRQRLDEALEALELLCEPVPPPKSDFEYMRYFGGNSENPDDLKARETQRHALYKATAEFVRACNNLADDMEAAGYNAKQIMTIKIRLAFYINLRDVIRNYSGEQIDLKAFEADMRYLIDKYIQADDSVVISPFADMPLLDVIIKSGIADAINSLPKTIKKNETAISETIENNVRSTIIKSHLIDPAYFEKMSKLLDEIIKLRKNQAIDYQKYLEKIAELANSIVNPPTVPKPIDTPAKRALYNNLGQNEVLALQVHTVVMSSKLPMWRGHSAKENVIKSAIYKVLNDIDEVNRIFEIIKQQQEY